jgi:hypothetical protein
VIVALELGNGWPWFLGSLAILNAGCLYAALTEGRTRYRPRHNRAAIHGTPPFDR